MSTATNNTLRAASHADADLIAGILVDSFVEYEPLYTPEGFAATALNARDVTARLAEGPIWLALSDNQLVGTMSVVLKGDAVYIRGMAVLPVARGRGIGRLLLDHAEKYARAKGCNRLLLSTTPFLTEAIQLYERSGFVRTEDGPHDLFGTPLFTMEKTLSG
jgi:GNAT superfamily N-acetyltransferase